MSKLVFLFACVALFQIATAALQCYSCDGVTCEKAMDDWQKTPCGEKVVDPNTEFVCLKQVYKDATTKKETSVRKCALQKKDEKYKCQVSGEEITCETCKTDLCNSSASISLSFVAVAGIFVAMLVPKFYA